ncbi:type I polyketide synthase [Streptomyces sp. R44]|uniref:Type I polyketide synthase n=1 Tax=Streptomyces sp. R44 TaxID=3238633 RepID=A0AB39SVH7_9ACTN
MSRDRSLDIAVTGMAGRFPGAPDVARLWEAIAQGRTLLHRLTPEELEQSGIPAELADDPAYVPVHGRLDDADRFDHAFFGVSPREARLLDPQQRLMLECAWSALEDAGHPLRAPDTRRTAVYAAASSSEHLRALLAGGELDDPEFDEAIVANERDFLATRIAYKLGLTGPAMAVLTACSSSLVAVHLAMQALNNGECDQALVVAASANAPQAGHVHIPGGILSASGVCRPFDADSDGAVGGSGVVGIVLRRFQDAVDEAAPMHGVLLGSAVNNDGAAKPGFSAPAAAGQERVIREALAAADIDASSLGYLETHGTGTRVGDPIEWSAASAVLEELGAAPGQVRVGAVKGTIGHLDAAAGLAGLVKALLVVGRGTVPPLANFTGPNPLLDLDGSPLALPSAAGPWEGPEPRRAAVSSFGIGGTNAHVLVEQPPAQPSAQPPAQPSAQPPAQPSDTAEDLSPAAEAPGAARLVVLSAADPAALRRAKARLADHLDAVPETVADVARTLARRAPLPYRGTVVASTAAELAAGLRAAAPEAVAAEPVPAPLVFLLPGQGTQTPGMAQPFTRALPGFADALDACLRAFEPPLAAELAEALHDETFPAERLEATRLAQPALFAVEYAAATALIGLGLRPSALIGHSLGELTAACLAGSLDLPTAARLVEHRGRLMQDCEPGAMLAVTCSAAEAERLLAESGAGLEIAAVNTATDTVLTGPFAEIDAFTAWLGDRHRSRRLRTSHAFHSALMDPAAAGLREVLAGIRPAPAEVPWAGNTDGALVPAGEVVTAERFAEQLRRPVRFADGIATLTAAFPGALAVEVGPGRVLSALAEAAGLDATPLCREVSAEGADRSVSAALGRLWAAGQPVAVERLAGPGRARHLPAYPFEGPRWPLPRRRVTAVADPAPAPEKPLAGAEEHLAPEEETRGPVELVHELWSEQLGLDGIRDGADFFELGGDSLTVTRLARRMGQVFGVDVPVRDLLAVRTVDGHVALVEDLLIQQLVAEAEGAL